MPWFMTPFGPQYVVEPGTVDEFERRDYTPLTTQQAADYFAGVAVPDPPSFATEAEVPGIVASAIAAGTGPVAEELRAASGPLGDLRAFNIYQPHNYGAAGDGVADDTAEISAMLAAAAGERVVFPAGLTFAISNTLTPASGTHVFGLGAVIVGRNASGNLNAAGRHFDLTNDDITIEGLTFAIPSTALSLGSGEDSVIHITGGRNRVTKCRFEQMGVDAAVFVKGLVALDNLIDDNHVDGSRIVYSYAGASRTTCRGNLVANAPNRALNGVNNGGAGVWNTDCLVADNTIVDSANMGIEDSGWATIIRGNRVLSPAGMGISAVGVLATVADNTIEAPEQAGIEVSSSGMKVTGNQVIAPAASTHAGIVVNNHNSDSSYRGATITGNHLVGWDSCVQLTGADYYTATITGNVFQDWIGRGIGVGPGLGAAVTGNAFVQTKPRPAGTRYGVSLDGPALVSGNRFVYTASTAGDPGGYDTAIRPAPGSDSSQIIGNLVDGGGVTSPAGVYVTATNGATPAGLVIFGNSATNGAQFDFGFMVDPITFANVGVNPPTVTGSKGGNAALTSLLTTLDSLGFIIDATS